MRRNRFWGILLMLAMPWGSQANAQPEIASASPPPNDGFYADRFPGSDILAQASAAFAACNWTCTVVIPPRADGHPYTASTTLAIPLWNLSGPTLRMTGACIVYTGTGYAVDTYEVQPNPAAVRLHIVDGCLSGTAAALGGVRLLPTSDVTLTGTLIADFVNGDAVAIYGTEDVNIVGNYDFTNNRYGVRIQGTFCRQGLPLSQGGRPDYSCTDTFNMKGCDGTTFAAHDGVCGYAGNMVHVHDGALSNLTWDIYEQGPPGLEHLSNSYQNNELNGGGGGIFLEISRGDTISSNYFEAKSGRFIVLGNASVPDFYKATATTIESNYFTTNGKAAVSLENGDGTSITNNAELTGSPSACFLDSAKIGSTVFSNNKVASVSALCRQGLSNAGAREAAMAHFHGDPKDASRLEFVFREDDAGTVFLGGPPVSPSGTCAGEGQWVHSRDGHLSVCMGGVWVKKL